MSLFILSLFLFVSFFFWGILKLIWNLIMVIYFIIHHFIGYSGIDLKICGLVILTCTLQALSFLVWLIWIFGLPIFGDAIFI